jgi:hypothetical protein
VRRTATIGAAIIGIALLVGALVIGASLLRTEPPVTGVLARPVAGEVRADYLADGTPVFVVGHADGTVSVLSAFDTHVPFQLGKLNWWCPSAQGFDNPSHGSKWNEYGLKIDGPAPLSLRSFDVNVAGSRIEVGASRPGPPLDERAIGSAAGRVWCMTPDDEAIYHDFPDWRMWDSPTEAVAEAPADEWILLEGELVADPPAQRVLLCAITGCEDSAVAANVEMPDRNLQFGPLGIGRYIAHVRDGALVDVTRVVAPDG